MWSFFSRDSTKDFPYEIGENVAGKVLKFDSFGNEQNFFPIFLLCFDCAKKKSLRIVQYKYIVDLISFQESRKEAYGA